MTIDEILEQVRTLLANWCRGDACVVALGAHTGAPLHTREIAKLDAVDGSNGRVNEQEETSGGKRHT